MRIIILALLLVVVVAAFVMTNAALPKSTTVTFDGRSFLVNNERKLFIAGSVHYPRASRNDWPQIFEQAKANGINLIQTYVFWDIHEPQNNQWNFPTDPTSSNDLAAFIKEAGEHGLYVHLRISGYVCAEWNFGGMPGWLRNLKSTLRTYDEVWMKELSEYFEKTISIVNNAKLFAKDGGPVIMVQMENEYGNMEKYYGVKGRKYVKWLSEYATSLNHKIGGIPWIMCQQGEGTGTAPSANIVNTCNGFYCDNWISKHVADFPNQPHMWTENWPGWFQHWGEPIPHRPAVDVAFSVARWFARGGSYMNYYMAFGGTTFGRSVGGPVIVTSYDYDVQINEYTLRAEPKFTLLQQLHSILLQYEAVILGQTPPEAVIIADNCESHTYGVGSEAISFFSNWDTSSSCTFPLPNGQSTIVPAWSVSIVTYDSSSTTCSKVIYNTKHNADMIGHNEKVYTTVSDFQLGKFTSYAEPIPSSSVPTIVEIPTIIAEKPLEQLSVTADATDYLWYSTAIPTTYPTDTNVTLSFTSGAAGGGLYYLYIDETLVGSVLGTTAGPSSDSADILVTSDVTGVSTNTVVDEQGGSLLSTTTPLPVKTIITIPAGANHQLNILSVTMGLKNYGPYLERIEVGIVSKLTLDGVPLDGQVVHSIGLVGEVMNIPTQEMSSKAKKVRAADTTSACSSLCWYSSTFATPTSITPDAKTALELSSTMKKGAVWVNGHMLGRYWNVLASNTLSERDCSGCTNAYTGSYNGDKCRTGCGEPSQQYYKLPADWLVYGDNAMNTIVFFDELGNAHPEEVKLVTVSMK